MRDNSLDSYLRADAYNSLIFMKGRGRQLYLVGGFIRDILMGIDSRDRDYIVRGNIMSFVKSVQNNAGGTIVQFKCKDTIRLAMKDGRILDFSRLSGTLAENLAGRDFTMNALAWSPRAGMTDLHNGIKDIQRGIVRAISRHNLVADPLRMLRAYRFSAEIDGTVDATTRRIIRGNRLNIRDSASERITLEIFNLLNTRRASMHLKMALEDRLLNAIIPLSINRLRDNIRVMDEVETRILHLLPNKIKVLLHETFAQNLTYKGLLCLQILIRDADLEELMLYLALSRKILFRLNKASHGLELMRKVRRVSRERLFTVLSKAKDAALDVLILTRRLRFLRDLSKFREIESKGLLTAEEVMSIAGVESGPKLGELLTALKKEQFKGMVQTRGEAEAFLRELESA